MTTRIGLWGVFDAGDLSGPSTRAVVEAELQRRLPDACISAYSPLGHRRPAAVDGGLGSLPLGGGDPALPQRLSDELDCVVVCGEGALATPDWLDGLYGGGEDGAYAAPAATLLAGGLGPELEAHCPVAWSAVGAPLELSGPAGALIRAAGGRRPVRGVLEDGITARRLEAAGIGGLEPLPHPGMLLARILGADLLDRRQRFMELVEWVPRDAPPLIVHGHAGLLADVDEIVFALDARCRRSGHGVVAVSGGTGGEASFATALHQRLGDRCHRLPETITCEDLAAAVIHSAGVVGSSPLVAAIARSAGLPVGELGGAAGLSAADVIAQLDGPGENGTVAMIARLDSHFDRVAAFAARCPSDPERTGEQGSRSTDQTTRLHNLEVAAEVRLRRLLDERVIYQAELSRMELANRDRLDQSAQTLQRLRDESAQTEARLGLELVRLEERRVAEMAQLEADMAREVGRLGAELAAAKDEIRRVVTSRTWRYTEWAREAYRYARPRLRGR